YRTPIILYHYASHITVHSFPTRRSSDLEERVAPRAGRVLEPRDHVGVDHVVLAVAPPLVLASPGEVRRADGPLGEGVRVPADLPDRKSTRLNSSHEWISYAFS